MMKKLLLLPVFTIVLLTAAFSQQSVSGKVLGPGDVPIAGLILTTDAPAGRTLTDAMGQFMLPLPEEGRRILLHLPDREPVPVVLTDTAEVLIRVAADGSVSQEPQPSKS
jgi:hypothetical protein